MAQANALLSMPIKAFTNLSIRSRPLSSTPIRQFAFVPTARRLRRARPFGPSRLPAIALVDANEIVPEDKPIVAKTPEIAKTSIPSAPPPEPTVIRRVIMEKTPGIAKTSIPSAPPPEPTVIRKGTMEATREQELAVRKRKLGLVRQLGQYEAPAASRRERLASAQENREAHFPVGMKKIWLPFFNLTLIRTPNLHPRFAKFLVPLWLTKLDLRDFLWHGYEVRALNIRSVVVQRPTELRNPRALGERRKRMRRPRAMKYMTIEMDEPFRGPDLPDSFEALDVTIHKKLLKIEEDHTEANRTDGKADWVKGSDGLADVVKKRRETRDLAQQILRGEVKWTPTVKHYPRPVMMQIY